MKSIIFDLVSTCRGLFCRYTSRELVSFRSEAEINGFTYRNSCSAKPLLLFASKSANSDLDRIRQSLPVCRPAAFRLRLEVSNLVTARNWWALLQEVEWLAVSELRKSHSLWEQPFCLSTLLHCSSWHYALGPLWTLQFPESVAIPNDSNSHQRWSRCRTWLPNYTWVSSPPREPSTPLLALAIAHWWPCAVFWCTYWGRTFD